MGDLADDKMSLFNAQVLAVTTTSDPQAIPPRSKHLCATLVAKDVHAATTLDVKIQHSNDGDNWHDLVAFTQLVGANGIEFKNITTPVLGRVRGVATLVGATKAATVTLEVCYGR